VRGATATNDELTGNFGSAPEDTSINDYRFVALFAGKSLKVIFGVATLSRDQRTWLGRGSKSENDPIADPLRDPKSMVPTSAPAS